MKRSKKTFTNEPNDKVKRLGQERQENLGQGANNALFNSQLKYSVRKAVRSTA